MPTPPAPTFTVAPRSWFLAFLLVAPGCGQSKELAALCAASEAKNVDEVRRLLQQGGVDLNADQTTVVAWRCRPFPEALQRAEPDGLDEDRRSLEIATLMLDHKADPSGCFLLPMSKGKSSRGRSSGTDTPTPPCVIEYAVRNQSARFLRLVIDRGARLRGGAGARARGGGESREHGDGEDARGGRRAGERFPSGGRRSRQPHSALGAAMAGGNKDMIAYVRALIDAGADTTLSEAFMTPLEYAVWRPTRRPCASF